MIEWMLVLGAALWLGILTSISPCPLATNIAAMSYIGRGVGNPRLMLWTGVVYTLGRTLAYLVLGLALVNSLLAAPMLSQWLQTYMNQLLGPLLVLVGMILLGLIGFNLGGGGASHALQKRVDAMGIWGAGLLGILFALAFCPVSAALFFLSLIPLAVRVESGVLVPSVYGVGTALPVIVFAGLVALGARQVGQAFNRLTQVEWWARRITGVVFILIGIYMTLVHVFGVSIGV